MKGTRLLSRRQLNGYCAALGLSLPVVGTMTAALSGAPAIAADVTSNSPGRTMAHVRENTVALSLTLTPEELQTLDAAHPRSGR
jgi:hypothetical protein